MSLSGALNAASSGLSAAARAAATVSSNVANAETPGYGRREVELATHSLGGVRVVAITRAGDAALTGDRQAATAAGAAAAQRTDALERIGELIGLPGEDGSLTDLTSRLDSALTFAIGSPEDETVRTSVVIAAAELAGGINAAADGIEKARGRADAAIADDVETLNDLLSGIEDLNGSLGWTTDQSAGRAGLLDERAQLIEQVSAIVPVRVLSRPGDRIALISESGAMLFDGTAAQIGFEAAPGMTPRSRHPGNLAGLTVAGDDVSSTALGGGSLGAAFATRDEDGPALAAQLDSLAIALLDRGSGETPLFADPIPSLGGTGASQRLAVSEGAATSSGAGLGDAEDLASLRSALGFAVPDAGADDPASLILILQSSIGSAVARFDREGAAAAAIEEGLSLKEADSAVDIDAQMERLLRIESLYAANARVLQAADEMMRRLTEL